MKAIINAEFNEGKMTFFFNSHHCLASTYLGSGKKICDKMFVFCNVTIISNCRKMVKVLENLVSE